MDKCIYNGKIINSFDVAADIDLEMEIRQCSTLQCCNSDCNAPLRYRHGKIRSPHFAHIVTNPKCDYDIYSSKKSETFKEVQQKVYSVLKEKYGLAVDIDIKLIKEPSHFTPIVFKSNQMNFAIDITDKRITASTLQSRKEAYADMGYIGIQINVDEARNEELAECYDLYLPVRYELHKSVSHSAVVYDKYTKKFYCFYYDDAHYPGHFFANNVISQEFDISELTVTEHGLTVSNSEHKFAEWLQKRKSIYQKQLDKARRANEQRQQPKPREYYKTPPAPQAPRVVIPKSNEPAAECKPAFNSVEYHMQTGRCYAGLVKGERQSLNLNEIRINKKAVNYYHTFSDDEMEKLINNSFDFTVSNIMHMLTKMYFADNNEKAVFVRIYEKYLNAEQTAETAERLKLLEYAISEAEIFR